MSLFVSLTMLFMLVVSQASDEAFGTPPFYGANHDEVFHEWAQFFNKSYSSSTEESARFKTFMSNWRMIDSVNSKNLSYTLGLNQFADMTAAQFRLHVHGKYGSCLRRGDKTVQQMEKERRSSSSSDSADSSSKEQRVDVPSSIDWTTKGVVTPVKNQGGCGSCWAFSATGSMESRYAIAHGKLVSLSEQQLVDCDRADGNEGCDGGFETYAMKYAAKEGGLCSEEEYPYTSGNGKSGKCKVSSCKTKFDRPTGATYVKVDSATALEDSVLVGPVSVAIDAAQNAFQFYQRGVLSGRCGKKIDHAVLLVGYGVDGGKKYWKVKNSWGKSWGEKGYVRICRECGKNGNEGECGILSGPSFPDY